MNPLASTMRGMIREARRVGQNALSRKRGANREAFALVMHELYHSALNAPDGYPLRQTWRKASVGQRLRAIA